MRRLLYVIQTLFIQAAPWVVIIIIY